MKSSLLAIILLSAVSVYGQVLRDINYSYLYDPESKVSVTLRPVRLGGGWKVLYDLQLQDTAELPDFALDWKGYDALNVKDGNDLAGLISDQNQVKTANGLTGFVWFELADAPKIIVARVVYKPLKQAYLFYATLEAEYPVNDFLTVNNSINTKSYISTGSKATIGNSSGSWIVSYYSQRFPPAAPAFSESQGRVAKAMKADTIFTVSASEGLTFSKNGLYLFQKDTLSTQGFSVRASDDYPRYNKIQNLAGPFVYICTKQEFDKLELAGGNKNIFDRTVLGITNDQSRARLLIRNYFKRVELSNRYFTSYKEGWKTDRGMIYIIYGLPDRVYKFSDREIWEYKNATFNASFNFTKSSSVYDPDNYVLIREKKFQAIWYEVIELWRNARL
jgi:GWxTD domain-containing protein